MDFGSVSTVLALSAPLTVVILRDIRENITVKKLHYIWSKLTIESFLF